MHTASLPTTEYRLKKQSWSWTHDDDDDDAPVLGQQERRNINGGTWFASLSPTLRHDILRRVAVRRYRDGQQIATRHEDTDAWMACALGSLRVGLTSATGKSITIDYIEPGQWLGEDMVLGAEPHLHDIHAHGSVTVLKLSRSSFMQVFAEHEEFRLALMKKQRDSTRQLYERVDALKTMDLASRLAQVLVDLAHKHGLPSAGGEHIAIQLAQKELAQLLGASRQRVNEQLKRLEENNTIRLGIGGLTIEDMDTLKGLGHLAYED
ncbi:MAG: Crp/Fnr family transcriptional regulator [Burkholderiales bacterium]|nr:Crp/Fnr family transcriptional regulator [Burkholderiales bacterium]